MRVAVPVIVFVLMSSLSALLRQDAGGLLSALPPVARDYAAVAIGIGFWLSTAWLLKALLAAAILDYARRRRTRNKLPQLLIDVGALVIYLCAALVIVSQVFGQPLGGLLATSGVLAAVIGFAIQRMISDVFAGVALNVEQIVKLGDWIETASGIIGRVAEMSWRATRLVTYEGRMVVVPNSALVGNPFTNLNAPERYFRLNKTIRLDYSAPAERVVLILQTAMEATKGVLVEPKPIVLVEECGDSGILYSLNYWVLDYPDSFPISREVVINAMKFLDQAGFAPTYPKRDVTVLDRAVRQIERRVDLRTILRRTPFFLAFEDEALEILLQDIGLREFPAGAVIVGEGEPGSSLFIVVAGLLEVTKKTQAAQARTVGRLAPGDVFGEISLLTGAARSATITAATPTSLLEISKQQLEPVLASHPLALQELTRIEGERLANNESILALWPDEHQEIARMGVTAFLRQKIGRVFARHG